MEVKPLSLDFQHLENSKFFESFIFDLGITTYKLEDYGKDIFSKLFEESLLKSNKIRYNNSNNFNSSKTSDKEKKKNQEIEIELSFYLRQYSNIYCLESNINNILNGKINLCELVATGAGYSRWWLFKSKTNQIFIVSYSTYSILESNLPEIENIEFREITNFELENISFM